MDVRCSCPSRCSRRPGRRGSPSGPALTSCASPTRSPRRSSGATHSGRSCPRTRPMPTVAELTEAYGNFMLGPVRGPSVCDVCLTFTDGYPRCYTCARTPQALDALAPISYSVATGQLHHVLAAYKRQDGNVGRHLSIQLAAVLWRFLSGHENCLARAAGVPSF